VKFQFRGFRLWNWRKNQLQKLLPNVPEIEMKIWATKRKAQLRGGGGTEYEFSGRTMEAVEFGFIRKHYETRSLCCVVLWVWNKKERVTVLLSLVFRWVWRSFSSSSSTIFICFFTNTILLELWINKKFFEGNK